MIVAEYKLLKNMKLRVVLEPSDEGGYTIYVPSLPGCISEGEDVDEALTNIREAIELYLEPAEDISSQAGSIVSYFEASTDWDGSIS